MKASIAILLSSSSVPASAGEFNALGIDSGGLPARIGIIETAIEEGMFTDVNTSTNDELICAAPAKPTVKVAVVASSIVGVVVLTERM